MKTRFYNGFILTMEKDLSVVQGELWVEQNRVIYAGSPKETTISWDREIDLQGNLLMPGFKNAHTHSAMTFLRSLADDQPLQEWLTESIFPMEEKLTPDDIYHLTKLANLEYFTSGITANFDMYFHPEKVAKAAEDTGMRTVILSGLSDFNQSVAEVEQAYLELNNQEKYTGLVRYEMGFHAEYTSSKKLLEELAFLAHQYQAPIYTHISETQREVAECIQRHGVTPAVFLDQLGLFDFGGGGYHGVHLTAEDIEIFKKRNVSIVLNCSANLKLASGIAPISDFMDAGINIGVGTDGPASNNSLDMFKEMFLVSGLGKVRSGADQVAGDDVLLMATRGSAKAMNLTECDSLASGQLADLVVIDLHKPNMQPLNHITKNIVYSGSKDNVKLTMINGKIVYEDGQFHAGIDAEAIYRKANEIIQRMKA
ncbi:amidohydrolase [Enterococcus rivorum]|uniref:Amidohydrolase n=1 Tax=Enterococcus rivorum TaxID=762845 RepID=A0A1E5KVD7_9ENTE|nr:amidohydrolase [Enterococcus rivorum]MBP2100384.1 5-methylthioadenosine/S-adenosylhomocysteine deaminase [Enterococcus rivorum]OEH81768.1 amidohydrolase [Enterococcus rivorum]